jgi:hypothetical protein
MPQFVCTNLNIDKWQLSASKVMMIDIMPFNDRNFDGESFFCTHTFLLRLALVRLYAFTPAQSHSTRLHRGNRFNPA